MRRELSVIGRYSMLNNIQRIPPKPKHRAALSTRRHDSVSCSAMTGKLMNVHVFQDPCVSVEMFEDPCFFNPRGNTMSYALILIFTLGGRGISTEPVSDFRSMSDCEDAGRAAVSEFHPANERLSIEPVCVPVNPDI